MSLVLQAPHCAWSVRTGALCVRLLCVWSWRTSGSFVCGTSFRRLTAARTVPCTSSPDAISNLPAAHREEDFHLYITEENKTWDSRLRPCLTIDTLKKWQILCWIQILCFPLLYFVILRVLTREDTVKDMSFYIWSQGFLSGDKRTYYCYSFFLSALCTAHN